MMNRLDEFGLTPTQRRACIKRLRELANGAEPTDRRRGVCAELRGTLAKSGASGSMGYLMFDKIFANDTDYSYFCRRGWTGKAGRIRRTGAGIWAAVLELGL